MGRRLSGRMLVYMLMALLLIWPIQQMAGWFQPKEHQHKPIYMLYQVSLFQIELLNSYLSEASQSKSSRELDALKQILYSTSFTHERLALALDEDQLSSLSSISQLMQLVVRLQIGGERPLKSEEIKILQEAAMEFRGIYAAYEKLMSSRGSIITSQNELLEKHDKELAERIRKKLLQ